MALVLTLRPHEQVFINGCILRNSDRKTVLNVESRVAQILREQAFLDATQADTPFRRVYYLLQIALTDPAARSDMHAKIQLALADLAAGGCRVQSMRCLEAAGHLAGGDYYRALTALCPDMRGPMAISDDQRASA